MRLVELHADGLRCIDMPPQTVPDGGFLWIALQRDELPAAWPLLQQVAQDIGGSPLLDLHCRDLANATHASYYDYTSFYDLIIFRRLITGQKIAQGPQMAASPAQPARSGQNGHDNPFADIRTLTVGFAIYERLLISVHPEECDDAHYIIQRLGDADRHGADAGGVRNRLLSSPSDLSLRMINIMVDSYLEIRKPLNAQLKQWQTGLLNTDARFPHWNALMEARNQIDTLKELCDEQHDAMQEWLDALREQPADTLPGDPAQALLRQDHLNVRARDVVEHIDRVLRHVQRMDQTLDTAVQIHFSAQGNRTNDIMLALTTITAIFLPLNLITGVFGMNFHAMPLLAQPAGFWITMACMVSIALGMGLWFWRKRYLSTPK